MRFVAHESRDAKLPMLPQNALLPGGCLSRSLLGFHKRPLRHGSRLGTDFWTTSTSSLPSTPSESAARSKLTTPILGSSARHRGSEKVKRSLAAYLSAGSH